MSVIRLRRGTAAAWTAANPTLALGEPGLETDTLKWKVGDGTTAWTALPYFNPASFAGDAGDIPFTPAGTISATDVQAAIEEVAAEAGGGGGGGPTPTGTGFRHVTAGTEDAAAKLVEAADVASSLKASGAATATDEALRRLGTGTTHAAAGDDARFPSTGEKNALAGTQGTPGVGNKYVTDQDARLTDARAPTAHAHAGEDITTGTVAEARIDSAIARDTEVAATIAATKLDDLAAPDDNTDLDVSTSRHGLAPKLPNDATKYLDGTGAYTVPPSGAGGWTEIIKSGDESVASSVVVQNDDHLFFATVAGAAYEIELVIVYGSPAGAGTPDFKWDVGEDATVRGAVSGAVIAAADTVAASTVLTNQTAQIVGTAVANRMVRLLGHHVGGGGTFRLRWAQNTSNVNPTIVRAGSILRYRRIL